jgi:hypothetical protein
VRQTNNFGWLFASHLFKKTIFIMRNSKKHSLLIIILLYLSANFFMLLSNGWYWDDWCLFTSEGIMDIYSGVGLSFMGPITNWLINLTKNPALLYHILTGLFEIIGILVLYKILLLIKVKRSQTFWLTILYALLPYNIAKITMVSFFYSAGLLFFLLAILVFLYFYHNKSLIHRIISLCFFWCSFLFLPSTLVMELAFVLFFAIYCQNLNTNIKISDLKKVFRTLLNWSDFIFIPFTFWVFRAFFLKPTGIYVAEGYREITLNTILSTPANLILSFVKNFIGLESGAINLNRTPSIFLYLFILIAFLLIYLLKKHKLEKITKNNLFLYIGLYFFVFGAIPYLLVGLLPSFENYSSRQQILLKFGVANIFLYLVYLIRSPKAQIFILSSILSLFMVSTISYQVQYQKSWFKQLAIEKLIVEEKLLTEGVNFMIIDNTKNYNEYQIDYAFYCYTGIFLKAYGTQTRFAIDSRQLLTNTDNLEDFVNHSFFNMKDCKNISTFKYNLTINPGMLKLSNKQCIKMLYQYYFNKTKFDLSISKIIELRVSKFN